MAEDRQRRIGANEALFRQVNERMRDLNETFATFTGKIDLMCECGAATCTERIAMDPSAYEELRSDANLFAVVPGHEVPDVEYVVAQRDVYDVIRKREGVPSQIAEQTDPRA
ncbi:MAG TPA: hypothetical protein VE444_07620 [Gaiellaceae bacterium]|jgi:hypothetical protein|nr:hypothetical protein [Gaiellaceae bacterium]